MKRTGLILVAAALILFAGSTVWGASVQFFETDNDPGNVVVTIDGLSGGVISGVEYGVASARYNFPAALGFFARLLVEPGTTTPSDVFIIALGANGFKAGFFSDGWAGGSVAFGESLTITSFDGPSTDQQNMSAVGFWAYLKNHFDNRAFALAETGAPQTVFTFNNGALLITARSDWPEAPIPGTLLLLGSALVGLIFSGWRKYSI